MTRDRLKIAIVGCHRMLDQVRAPHNLAAGIAAIPGVRVVAVSDRAESARMRFLETWRGTWPGVSAYAEEERMLRECAADIVVLANSPGRHAEVIEAAVAAGARGILCDKPLCTTMAESDRILACCREHAVSFALALDRRWSPSWKRLRHEIAQEVIGRVLGVAINGVPELINHGCHWFDVALGFCGDAEPLWAMGEVDEPSDHARLDPPGRGLVRLATGATISIATGGGAPVPSVEVIGSCGRLLVLNGFLKEVPIEAYVLPASLETPVAGTRLRRIDLGEGDPTWPQGPLMIADLVASVHDGGATACGLEHARRASECGFALHASHQRNGERVAFPVHARSLRVPGPPFGNDAVPLAAALGVRS